MKKYLILTFVCLTILFSISGQEILLTYEDFPDIDTVDELV